MSMTPYERLGGEAAVRRLTDCFYDLMDADPKYAALRAIHHEEMAMIRGKLFKFMSGWLGGPGLYEEEYGHPRLRQRHMPFVVNVQLRNEWVACFAQAMAECGVEQSLAEELLLPVFTLGDWMRNQDEPQHAPPTPPMGMSPAERLPELKALLAEFGIGGYFTAA